MPRLLLFLLVIGVVVYTLVWLIQRGRTGPGPSAPPAPPRPAPDDDPVFLAQLDRRLREERRQRELEEARRRAAARQAAETAPDGSEVAKAEPTSSDEIDPAERGEGGERAAGGDHDDTIDPPARGV